VARFKSDRDQEYREFISKCADFKAEIAKETKARRFDYAEIEENEVNLKKLQSWLVKIRKLDFCGATLGVEAKQRLRAARHCLKHTPSAFSRCTMETNRKLTIAESGHQTAEPKRWLNRIVCGAGLTSAFGDFCYETTTVILPGFLAVLGIPAAVLGIIEGIADAVASFTKMISGYIADKLGHRKMLVVVGYGLTPMGQVLIAMAAGWPLLLIGRLVSWFGKGLRGPLRDAIVTQAICPETRGRAFGFHRAMDTVGAVVGPLLGVGLLGWAQGLSWEDPAGPFRVVLWFSILPGVLAVLAFQTLVKDPEHSPNPALQFFRALRGLPSRFKRYLGAVGLFGIGDFSHSLLILAATQLLASSMGMVQAAQMAGMLYVWRNIVQVIMSYPVGMLADRYGSLPVLNVGYALGVLTAIMTAMAF